MVGYVLEYLELFVKITKLGYKQTGFFYYCHSVASIFRYFHYAERPLIYCCPVLGWVQGQNFLHITKYCVCCVQLCKQAHELSS